MINFILIIDLINHGVDSSLVEKVKRGAQGLFDLSMEEKKKFGQREGEAEGYGQLFVILEEQKLRVGRFVFHGHLFSNLPLPFRFSFSLCLVL